MHFFTTWVGNFLQGDMGDSWRYQQGVPVTELVTTGIPNTLILLFAALVPLTLASIIGITQWISKKFDGMLVAFGVLPCLVLGLIFAAIIKIQLGASAFDDEAYWYRIVAGALTLGLTDGVLSELSLAFGYYVQRKKNVMLKSNFAWWLCTMHLSMLSIRCLDSIADVFYSCYPVWLLWKYC